MTCEYCGAPMEEGTIYCTQCGALQSQAGAAVPVTPGAIHPPEPEAVPTPAPAYPSQTPEKIKKHTPPAVRVVLNICTVLLCLLLSVSIIVTMLVIDLNRLVSREGLTAITRELLTMQEPVSSNQPAVYRLSAISGETAASGDTDDLVDLFYDAMKAEFGSEFQPTREQLAEFAAQSTIQDYLAEKLGSYVDDLINGTYNTTIDPDELLDVIDENADLVEEIFSVKVDRQFRKDLRKFLEENDIDQLIRTNILEPLAEIRVEGLQLPGGTGEGTLADLLAQLQFLSSGGAIAVMGLLDAIFIALLFLTNRFRLGNALLSAGIPALVVGVLLSLPVLVLQQFLPAMEWTTKADVVAAGVFAALTGRIAPVHYGTALIGLVLVVTGGVIRGVTKQQKLQLS